MRRIDIIKDFDPPKAGLRARAAPPPIDLDKIHEADWPTSLVEKTGMVGIYYQTAMVNDRTHNLCKALSITTELHHKRLTQLFRTNTPPPLKLVVGSLSKNHDGTGGGYHYGSSGTTLFSDVLFDRAKNRYDPAFTSFIFVAEATQPFAWFHSRGWADDSDQGEALSRVIAIDFMPGNLGPYGVSVKWLNNGRPDWTRQRTDFYLGRSIGCAMAFLFWARYKKRIPFDVIVAAGKDLPTATIEDIWNRLSRTKNVYLQMMKDINKAYKPGVTVPDDEEHEVLFRGMP